SHRVSTLSPAFNGNDDALQSTPSHRAGPRGQDCIWSDRLSAASSESQELPLIPFVDLRERLVLAGVEDGAVLEEVLGKHQRGGPLSGLTTRAWLLFPACR